MKAEIIGQKKGFQPVTLQIQIETEEDLIKLLCLFNESTNGLAQLCNKHLGVLGLQGNFSTYDMQVFGDIWGTLNHVYKSIK